MSDPSNLTTAVVTMTTAMGLLLSGGAVWIAVKNERLGAALLVGVAVATLWYVVISGPAQ
ncbi:hypothetical protein [Streptomyces lancefieldiae]|uniref:Uncharacterized protein n=1 Tax=Streptomyces lancefieldiae TaxID=3075520 RepID=A0ABU3B3A8_9ACTN|nr:hypothetical protein [Streptomyces sp. DSM 40712]MDT0616535.1 hypothetical protein [Streptomyces sp. DSM 40712]